MTASQQSYRDFWPYYLKQHSDPRNRWLHFIGTATGVFCLAAGTFLSDLILIVLAPILGYGLAWLGHFAVERNAPATFGNPLWSLISDFRMLGLWLTGRLSGELRRHGIRR